ncbi:MAG: hypothetical protein ACRD0I_02755 [Acidimicrobiales bacterium]
MFDKFDQIVRCRDGHLFTTIWIPLASFKAVRLGSKRWQHCPVGRHWVTVEMVDENSLSPSDLSQARSVHDIRIP